MTLRVNQFKKKARIDCTLEIEDEYHFILIFTFYCLLREKFIKKFLITTCII